MGFTGYAASSVDLRLHYKAWRALWTHWAHLCRPGATSLALLVTHAASCPDTISLISTWIPVMQFHTMQDSVLRAKQSPLCSHLSATLICSQRQLILMYKHCKARSMTGTLHAGPPCKGWPAVMRRRDHACRSHCAGGSPWRG